MGDAATGVSRLISGISSWGISELPHIMEAAGSAKSFKDYLGSYFYPIKERGW